MSAPPVHFYEHGYMRDRMLDTVRAWPPAKVLNPGIVDRRGGSQVARGRSLATSVGLNWRQRLPLINLKRRPRGLPADAVVYVWGAIMASGPFILDLDNPFALTGYNLRAFYLYRPILRRLLASKRCLQIRCMSDACRRSLLVALGPGLADKAQVCYPQPPLGLEDDPAALLDDICRFLFVSTRFELKGGPALLRAFARLAAERDDVSLEMITHLPDDYAEEAANCPRLQVHDARFSRSEIATRFMRHADVLVHPSYDDSFGMVALEALGNGLAVIVTDIYALPEMVDNGANGAVVPAPISQWQGDEPSRYFFDWPNFKQHVAATDTAGFEDALYQAMATMAGDRSGLLAARRASLALFHSRFRRPVTPPG